MQVLGHLVPLGKEVPPSLRKKAGRVVTRRPRPVLNPQRDSPSLVGGKLPNHISRSGSDMGWSGATGATPQFGALGDIRLFYGLACPPARAFNSDKNVRVAPALSEQHSDGPVGHHREAQLVIGRNAWRIAHLSLMAKGFQDLTKARLSDPWRGGAKVVDTLRPFTRGRGAQPDALTPIVALFSCSCLSTRHVPYLEIPVNQGSDQPEIGTQGTKCRHVDTNSSRKG